MTFDVTGLTEVKGKKRNGWVTRYYLDSSGHCVAKSCSRCHTVLCASTFRRGSNRYGLQGHCRSCQDVYNKQRIANLSGDSRENYRSVKNRSWARSKSRRRSRSASERDLDFIRIHGGTSKACAYCGTVTEMDRFYTDRNNSDGRVRRCPPCHNNHRDMKRYGTFEEFWEANCVPLRCYLCEGPYEEVEHLIPLSHGRGEDIPSNTRPACRQCNGSSGKWYRPLEHYIFSVNHPTKTRAQILYEIVMSGTWPFTNTTPQEFLEQCKLAEKEAASVL